MTDMQTLRTDCWIQLPDGSTTTAAEILKWRDTRLAPDCIVIEQLNLDELTALRRFAETCEDDESYDLDKPMTQRLTMRGAIYKIPSKRDWLGLTDIGIAMLTAAKESL